MCAALAAVVLLRWVNPPTSAFMLEWRLASRAGPVDYQWVDYPEISPDAFDRQIAVNLRAPLELLQALLPEMQARGWGRVLSIGSIQQLRPHPQMLIYAGTKSAQLNWVRNLARQVGDSGVWTARKAPWSPRPICHRPCKQGGLPDS